MRGGGGGGRGGGGQGLGGQQIGGHVQVDRQLHVAEVLRVQDAVEGHVVVTDEGHVLR